jgi:hypothetical protein
MIKYLKEHPLAGVMAAALVLRLLAAVFSKGYMASDDHFETVNIAYNWLRDGLLGADGYLHWRGRPAETFPRFPLYTVTLYWIMKLMYVLGYDALDKIMYGVRLAHGLFSLVGVWAVYRIIELATGSRRWAVYGGLFMAAHFAMPYLSVRNLIEMVGGIFWILALYFLYRYRHDPHVKWLIVAGIVTGLAWMIRFQIVLAFWIVPLVLWWEQKNIKPALTYGLAVAVMVLIAGLVDLAAMGTFMGTSLNYFPQNLKVETMYNTSVFIYLGVILAYFIPPFSLVALALSCRKSFFRRHQVLVISTLAFIVIHTILPNRQERFMIPIVPALMVIIVLALHQYHLEGGTLFRRRKLWNALLGFTLAVNIVLLIPFTFYYGHKGMVEPLVEIERISPTKPTVVFFSPDKYRNVPFLYGGFEPIGRRYVYDWKDIDTVLSKEADTFDYFLLYPVREEDLASYRDSLSRRVGPIELAFHVEPSLIDNIVHRLNPRYNPSEEVWVFRPASS